METGCIWFGDIIGCCDDEEGNDGPPLILFVGGLYGARCCTLL